MDKFYKWLEDNNYAIYDIDEEVYLLFSQDAESAIVPTDLMLIGYKLKYLQEESNIKNLNMREMLNNLYLNELIGE